MPPELVTIALSFSVLTSGVFWWLAVRAVRGIDHSIATVVATQAKLSEAVEALARRSSDDNAKLAVELASVRTRVTALEFLVHRALPGSAPR